MSFILENAGYASETSMDLAALDAHTELVSLFGNAETAKLAGALQSYVRGSLVDDYRAAVICSALRKQYKGGKTSIYKRAADVAERVGFERANFSRYADVADRFFLPAMGENPDEQALAIMNTGFTISTLHELRKVPYIVILDGLEQSYYAADCTSKIARAVNVAWRDISDHVTGTDGEKLYEYYRLHMASELSEPEPAAKRGFAVYQWKSRDSWLEALEARYTAPVESDGVESSDKEKSEELASHTSKEEAPIAQGYMALYIRVPNTPVEISGVCSTEEYNNFSAHIVRCGAAMYAASGTTFYMLDGACLSVSRMDISEQDIETCKDRLTADILSDCAEQGLDTISSVKAAAAANGDNWYTAYTSRYGKITDRAMEMFKTAVDVDKSRREQTDN